MASFWSAAARVAGDIHDAASIRPRIAVCKLPTIASIIFFHFHLLFHVDKFDIKAKFTGYQLNYFRIQPLVNGYHDTKTHTLADHFSEANVHRVGQFTHGNEFGYLQLVIFCPFHCFCGFITAFTAELFHALALTTTTRKLSLGFLYLSLNFFFVNLFIFTFGKCRPLTRAVATTKAVTALLATPADIERPLPDGYPTLQSLDAHGWLPVPRSKLPFRSIVAASTTPAARSRIIVSDRTNTIAIVIPRNFRARALDIR